MSKVMPFGSMYQNLRRGLNDSTKAHQNHIRLMKKRLNGVITQQSFKRLMKSV